MSVQAPPRVLAPGDGETVWMEGLGARLMVRGEQSGGGFSLVEHPMKPRSVGSPVHTHSREDEYSYVLEGRVTVQIGDEVVEAGPGELVFKPRGVPHAFWNAGDEPARLLEIVSPAGFERFFLEMADAMAHERWDEADALFARYGLTYEPGSEERLAREHGLGGAAL